MTSSVDTTAAAAAAEWARHAPVFVLAKGEPYWPCSIGDYARNSRVVSAADPRKVLLDSVADPADIMRFDNAALQLKTKEARQGARNARAYPAGAEAYALRHTMTYSEPEHGTYAATDLTYVLWFAHNGTLAPHAGDREYVVVRLRDGKPVGVHYSNHNGGYWRPWAEVAKEGERPVVYVARESHAMYHAPGTHRRLMGFGNDVTHAGGTRLAYTIVDARDPAKPWLRWTGGRAAGDLRPILRDGTFWAPPHNCPVTDTPALVAARLPRAAQVGILVALAVLAAAFVGLGLWFHRAWLAMLSVLPAFGLGMMWFVAASTPSIATQGNVWI